MNLKHTTGQEDATLNGMECDTKDVVVEIVQRLDSLLTEKDVEIERLKEELKDATDLNEKRGERIQSLESELDEANDAVAELGGRVDELTRG